MKLENAMNFRGFLAWVALSSALVAPASAQRMGDGETLDRILPDIRAAHPGRLSDAEPWIDDNGRTHYRIKWMTPEGRILYFDADARTGRYSSSGGQRDVRDGQPRPSDSSRPRDDNGSARPSRDDNGQARPTRDDGGRPPNDDHARHHENWSDGGPFGDGGRDGRDQNGRGDLRGNADPRGGDWRGGRGDTGGWHHHGRN